MDGIDLILFLNGSIDIHAGFQKFLQDFDRCIFLQGNTENDTFFVFFQCLQNTFFNQAISFKTSVSPTDLLKVCKYVEAKMGRPMEEPQYDEQGNRIYKSRIIDIDILLYGNQTIDLPELKIPHPRLQEREFALIPLREIFTDY